MNIIFLDVDGVLNSLNHAKELYKINKRPYSGYDYPFDPVCLYNLKELVKMTNAYLVITSTWRKHEIGKKTLLNELKKYGLDTRVIGFTKILNKTREEEIKDFLEILGENVNYIIIDDDNDLADLNKYLIQTNFETGLTEKEVNDGVKRLTKYKKCDL